MKPLNLNEYKAAEKQPLNLSDYSTDSGVLGATKDAALKALSGAKKTIGNVFDAFSDTPFIQSIAETSFMKEAGAGLEQIAQEEKRPVYSAKPILFRKTS